MKKRLNKITIKRGLLATLQHMFALGISVLVAIIVMNSYIIVDNMYGERIRYNIEFLENSEAFVESDIFTEMFRSSINDITQYAVVKGQMETDGSFDGSKLVNVTEYVNRKTKKSQCDITAVYPLEDLIKWGRYGTSMEEWSFPSKTDFLMYFGTDGNEFIYNLLKEIGEEIVLPYTDEEMEEMSSEEIEEKMQSILMEKLTNKQIVDTLFDTVVSQMETKAGKTLEIVSSGGQEKITLSGLNCRYMTVDGKNLVQLASNWVSYSMLEMNVIETIINMTDNYSKYINRNQVYDLGNTNVQFLVRTNTVDGIKHYTNMRSAQINQDQATLNEYFKQLGKYVIYSPDDMKFQSNAEITESEMFNNVSGYEYAFPENTQIWIGVDTKFKVENDQYFYVFNTYNNLVPHIWKFMMAILACSLGWIILSVYFTLTTGKVYDENGKMISRLNAFDKIPTEIAGGAMVAVVIGFVMGFAYLSDVLETNIYFKYDSWISETSYAKAYFVMLISGYGMLMSIMAQGFWGSFLRRLRLGVLWKGSISYNILNVIQGMARGITRNRYAMIRTLVPYNIFLIFNLASVLGLYVTMRMDEVYFVLCLTVLLAVDISVGFYLYKRASEVNDIIDGINKIRSGDVEYVLDSENLHGDNKELAEAVNNIGEGIRKAVETSMKDERMKADLITNVSHDIKTPLTSIINYVALLKREKITTEPIKSYIDVLDAKSQRLKHLTDDLVEASKISSGNIVLENAQMNLYELIMQATGEFSEKFEDCGLTAVLNDCQDYTTIYADSRRMWRVVENLFNNVCKYAMPGTRVYIDVHNEGGKVEASIKNISQSALNFKPEELTERFIRGDISRTTEGSGLGLSIARNLTELQGGEFIIFLDGDLFKATVRFPEYKK